MNTLKACLKLCMSELLILSLYLLTLLRRPPLLSCLKGSLATSSVIGLCWPVLAEDRVAGLEKLKLIFLLRSDFHDTRNQVGIGKKPANLQSICDNILSLTEYEVNNVVLKLLDYIGYKPLRKCCHSLTVPILGSRVR